MSRKSSLLIVLGVSIIAIASFAQDSTVNLVLERCPFGMKYSIECVDCFCNPQTGTTECSDEQCISLESMCPNGTKFSIGCGNVCHCNRANGDTVCMVLRCKKKYMKFLSSQEKDFKLPRN